MKQCRLDTNILSYFLRDDTPVVEKFRIYRQHYPYLSFSIFTYYEIKAGLTYWDAHKKMQRFEQLAAVNKILPFDESVANTTSDIYCNLRNRGLWERGDRGLLNVMRTIAFGGWGERRSHLKVSHHVSHNNR